MATPRVFVSSTFYDLQEIRYSLKKFIEDYGLEAVLSEFGDIFYGYDKHVQDACLSEIVTCNLFILIIGNNYGSIYHNQDVVVDTPDSITLKEFKESLNKNIKKHIFINRNVKYDYENFKRFYEEQEKKFFTHTKIEKSQIESKKLEIKNSLYESYPFPNKNYKNIFRFLEIIYTLKINNAVYAYETFDDIKDNLKKQWSGFIYDNLIDKNIVEARDLKILNDKIDNIDKQITSLIKGKINDNEDKLTFNIDSLKEQYLNKNFLDVKKQLNTLLENIFYYESFGEPSPRMILSVKVNEDFLNKAIERIKSVIDIFKWANVVSIQEIFSTSDGFRYTYYTNHDEISVETIIDFYSIYSSMERKLDKTEFDKLQTFIIKYMNKFYEPETDRGNGEDPNDLPF